MADFTVMPKGFFVYGYERNAVGGGVHEMLEDRRFTPTPEEFATMVAKAQSWRETHELDGKFAEQTNDDWLAGSCRRVVAEIDQTLETWRARWREMSEKVAA